MKDELYLGPVPVEEDCSQVGSIGYLQRSRVECRAYINQLIREFGEPPEGSSLKIKACPHDFGTYHEVVVTFDDDIRESVEWAFNVEDKLPMTWDTEAKVELAFLYISF